jgi:hypothetical protein
MTLPFDKTAVLKEIEGLKIIAILIPLKKIIQEFFRLLISDRMTASDPC